VNHRCANSAREVGARMKRVLSFIRRKFLLLVALALIVLALSTIDFMPGTRSQSELDFARRKVELERQAHDAELKRGR
jgi:hypothetical protein